VLPETGAADAEVVGERISELLRKDVEEPALSVSVGVAAYPRDAESVGPLLYAADAALYARKGKRIRFVSAGLPIEPSNNGGLRAVSRSVQPASGKL
jgi:GGDEF domain-containing protein